MHSQITHHYILSQPRVMILQFDFCRTFNNEVTVIHNQNHQFHVAVLKADLYTSLAPHKNIDITIRIAFKLSCITRLCLSKMDSSQYRKPNNVMYIEIHINNTHKTQQNKSKAKPLIEYEILTNPDDLKSFKLLISSSKNETFTLLLTQVVVKT